MICNRLKQDWVLYVNTFKMHFFETRENMLENEGTSEKGEILVTNHQESMWETDVKTALTEQGPPYVLHFLDLNVQLHGLHSRNSPSIMGISCLSTMIVIAIISNLATCICNK